MLNRKIRGELFENSFWSIILTGVSRLGTLIFAILATRLLMPEGYGLYTLVFSLAMIFLTLSDLGINQVGIRYISNCLKEKKNPYPYYKYLIKIKIRLSIIVLFVILILTPLFSKLLFKNQAVFWPLIISSFFVFIYSIEGFYANIFYSFEKIRYLVLREFITQSLRILALFSIVLFLPVRVRITAVFISFLLIVFLTFIINIYNLRKIISEKYKDENQKIDKLGVKRFIFFFSLASICLVLFSNMDAIILGLFVSPEYVGYYKAALSLILGLIGLLAFPNMFLLSVFSKVSKKNLEKILGAVFRYMSLFAIPITLGVVVLARYFIRIIYGYEYLNSVLPLCILAPIILPAIIVNLIVFVFTALEKPKLFAKIISYTALLNIILNFLLIGILNMASPIYAMVGASIACLLSWLFYFFRSYGLLKKEFKIYLDFKNILKPIIAGTFMCAFILTLSKIIGDMNLYTGIFVLISAIFSYFLVLFLISGLTKLDLEFFYKIIKPSKKK